MNPIILLTFDVEDWFQVENLKQCIPFSSWSSCELRIEKNIHRILDLLDSINSSNPMNPSNPKATFFVLGWIAERLPHLVREIHGRGHEIASHGYYHTLCREQSADELRADLVKTKGLLEDLTGTPVYGYRAPSFSINDDILGLIEQTGHLYDSSFNSFGLNKRYGRVRINGSNGDGILYKLSDSFYELPISNLCIAKQPLPWGGGGYFRLIPLFVFKHGVERLLKKHGAYLIYLHPWEFDHDQPRVHGISRSSELRHYLNLSRTFKKFSNFLNHFKDFTFRTCYEYITKAHHCNLSTQPRLIV